MSQFSYKGHDFYYEVTGAGAPLVLLNGIMMSTRSWNPFVQTLSTYFSLIRLDFIDQGQSVKAQDFSYIQADQVEVVKALLDHLTLDTAHIVGISYGGEIALQFAIKYPQRVNRLMLFNTTAYTTTWLKHIGHSWIEVGKTKNPDAYYKTTIPVIYSQHFYEREQAWMEKRKNLLYDVFQNDVFLTSIERLTRSAETFDVRNQLSQITTKTLVVAAEYDTLTPPSDQYYLHHHIKNSEYLMIPNCGHASMYEKPMLFVSLILGFALNNQLDYVI